MVVYTYCNTLYYKFNEKNTDGHCILPNSKKAPCIKVLTRSLAHYMYANVS